MIVDNVTDENISDESRLNWLSYWNHFSKMEYCHCSEVNCIAKHEHGVLVKKGSTLKDKLYVVPMCKEHGYSHVKRIQLDDSVELVCAERCL